MSMIMPTNPGSTMSTLARAKARRSKRVKRPPEDTTISLQQLLPPGSKDVICELIAAYYNGTEVEIVRKGQLTAAANSFGIDWASDKGRKKLVLRAWAKFTGLDRLAALLLFHWDEEELNDEETQDVRSAAKELRRHERKFREAVTWLCSSKDLAKQIQEHWLRTKGEPRNLVFGRYPTIDQRSESSLKYLEDHGI